MIYITEDDLTLLYSQSNCSWINNTKHQSKKRYKNDQPEIEITLHKSNFREKHVKKRVDVISGYLASKQNIIVGVRVDRAIETQTPLSN